MIKKIKNQEDLMQYSLFFKNAKCELKKKKKGARKFTSIISFNPPNNPTS